MLRKLGYIAIGGLLALGIVFGGAAVFAQVDDSETTPEDTPAETEEEASPAWPGLDSRRTRGWGLEFNQDDESEALAEALGITVEELDVARESARAAVLDQAVADGVITQEQADAILESGRGIRQGHGLYQSEYDEFLAEALGISVDELQAARNEVWAARLAAMVEAGVLTQEEADMIAARKAVQERMDYEALNAAALAAYEEAIAQALADGVITQEQADQLLDDAANFQGFGPGIFGRGGRGHHRGGGRGFSGGMGFDVQPSTTGTGVDA